jgi:choline transport protein
MAFTTILSLIIIGSNTAFLVIATLSQTGLLSSYLLAISCILSKRICGQSFPKSRFDLGKVGGFVVNIIAVCFLALALVMTFFPSAPHPNARGMNWSILIYGCVVIFFLAYYYFKGRYVYRGPVEDVRKDI